MKSKLVAALGLAASLAFSGVAEAAFTFVNVGDKESYTFGAFSSGQPVTDVSAQLDVELTGINGSAFTFKFTAANTSGSGGSNLTHAQLTGIGFDVEQPDGAFTATGSDPFKFERYDASYPGSGTSSLDLCLASKNGGGECTGTGSGKTGLSMGTSAMFDVVLDFGAAPVPAGVALDNFFVRYQSIQYDNQGDQSASSFAITVAPPVPEPSTWLLLLSGFGVAATMLRRRTWVKAGPVTA